MKLEEHKPSHIFSMSILIHDDYLKKSKIVNWLHFERDERYTWIIIRLGIYVVLFWLGQF